MTRWQMMQSGGVAILVALVCTGCFVSAGDQDEERWQEDFEGDEQTVEGASSDSGDVLSVPLDARMASVMTSPTLYAVSELERQGATTYDVTIALFDDAHRSYCLLPEDPDIAPLYGGAQVFVRLEAAVEARDLIDPTEPQGGVCPVGEYLIEKGESSYYDNSIWSMLDDNEALYRRWDQSGELVSEEFGKTGYVRFEQTAEGTCAMHVDINLGKRIHAVYDTVLGIDPGASIQCDYTP